MLNFARSRHTEMRRIYLFGSKKHSAQSAKFGLHAVHPDDFVLDVASIDPGSFAAAVREDLGHYRAPPLTLADYVSSMHRAGVPRTAEHIGRLDVILREQDGQPDT